MANVEALKNHLEALRNAIPELKGVLLASSEGLPIAHSLTNGADPSTIASQLSTLITDLVNAAPDALIVVAKIIPLGYSNTNYNSYIAKIPGVVQAHSSNHVIMVDMSTLPTSDIRGSGNVHPTDQGYADMATLWYGAIKSYLP